MFVDDRTVFSRKCAEFLKTPMTHTCKRSIFVFGKISSSFPLQFCDSKNRRELERVGLKVFRVESSEMLRTYS